MKYKDILDDAYIDLVLLISKINKRERWVCNWSDPKQLKWNLEINWHSLPSRDSGTYIMAMGTRYVQKVRTELYFKPGKEIEQEIITTFGKERIKLALWESPMNTKSPITLLTAIEQGKIKPGDTVILSKPPEKLIYNNDGYFHDENDEPQDWSAEHWMCKDFEIVKTELEIMTSEKAQLEHFSHVDIGSNTFDEIFSFAEKNGIIKRQLRIEKAIPLVEIALRSFRTDCQNYKNLEKALKILKGNDQ